MARISKGALARAQKQTTTKYSLTRAELEQYGAKCVDQYVKDHAAELAAQKRRMIDELEHAAKLADEDMQKKHEAHMAECEKMVEDQWKERQAIFEKKDNNESVAGIMVLLLNFISHVLVEDCGFPAYKGKPNKTTRLCEKVMRKLNDISKDETQDIRNYSTKVMDEVGFEFIKDYFEVSTIREIKEWAGHKPLIYTGETNDLGYEETECPHCNEKYIVNRYIKFCPICGTGVIDEGGEQ